jgi:hypothetical protein
MLMKKNKFMDSQKTWKVKLKLRFWTTIGKYKEAAHMA